MAMKNAQSSIPREGQALRTLAVSIVVAAGLIFAGLMILSFSVLSQSPIGGWMEAFFVDRGVHYVLLAAIVGYYVYLQRG